MYNAYLFVVENEVSTANKLVRVAGIFERHETETLRSARLSVNHNRAIYHFAECGEECSHGLRRRCMRQTSYEVARVAEMLLSRNCPFGVNLPRTTNVSMR